MECLFSRLPFTYMLREYHSLPNAGTLSAPAQAHRSDWQ
jgi:hypothetical protein